MLFCIIASIGFAGIKFSRVVTTGTISFALALSCCIAFASPPIWNNIPNNSPMMAATATIPIVVRIPLCTSFFTCVPSSICKIT